MFHPCSTTLKTRERTASVRRKASEKAPSIVNFARPRYRGLLRHASGKSGEEGYNSNNGYTTASAAETEQGCLRIDAEYQKHLHSALDMLCLATLRWQTARLCGSPIGVLPGDRPRRPRHRVRPENSHPNPAAG